MADSTTSRDLAPDAAALQTDASALHAAVKSIASIAALGSRALSAERCAVTWSNGARSEIVWIPDADSRWDAAIVTVLSALDNRVNDRIVAERDPLRPSNAA